MTDLPTLTFFFGPPEPDDGVSLKLALSNNNVSAPCVLKFPFSLERVPLLLKALNARQYLDYPNNERRLIKAGEDSEQIAEELRSLGLWEDGAVAVDVHTRVGKLLGGVLFAETVVQNYFEEMRNAVLKEGGGELILRFDPQATALAALPWEIAHDGTQPMLFAKGARLNCTRIMFPQTVPTKPVGARLQILTIAPRVQIDQVGRAFEQLARSRMQNELKALPIDIESLTYATMADLHKRLNEGKLVDVLDYYGHGIFTSKGGALLFEDSQGNPDPVHANRLAALPNLPPLIILHACQSAQMDIDEPFAGIATALSAAGARAVVAMQLTISMDAATNTVVPTLYHSLAVGKSVQYAVSEARHKLYTAEPEGRSWYLPVLYLRQQGSEPFVLLERPSSYPLNPFAGEGALSDITQFVGRKEAVQRIESRLRTKGHISIVGGFGSGKSTMLVKIAAEMAQSAAPDAQVIWLPIQRNMKQIEAKLELARRLGGSSAKATEVTNLCAGKHLILLLDDLGKLDKEERGLEVRFWLRDLSQDRFNATIQLVATSPRPLNEIFKGDENPDWSPLHNVLTDIVNLGPFTLEEAQLFVTKRLEGTPFNYRDFADIVVKPIMPRALRDACRTRYEELCGQNI